MSRTHAALALLFLAALSALQCDGGVVPRVQILPGHGIAMTGYHGGPTRSGWNDAESRLTPENVRKGLALAWESEAFDAVEVDGVAFTPHLYASPLYVDDVAIRAGAESDVSASVVIAATSNGWAYAVSAADVRLAGAFRGAGSILWRRQLGHPARPERSSDGVPLGVLSTPVVDLAQKRVYVASADATLGWQVYALDLADGAVLPGWPVPLSADVVTRANRNRRANGDLGNVSFADVRVLSQRGALNLSPAGDHLYVPFGSYVDGAVGWMVAIDTLGARVEASFSGSVDNVVPQPGDADSNLASAGMWGAGGTVIDAAGNVFVTTGNSSEESGATPGTWGNTLLQWDATLHLRASYSPFNYCLLDRGDTDLGGASALVLDEPRATSTHLMVFGGKQGNVYLVDRDHLAGGDVQRPPCDWQHPPLPSTDRSLLSPVTQPYYTPPSLGPLNVFGPYSDAPNDNKINAAKMRTAPALFRDGTNQTYVYLAGNARVPGNLDALAPPSVVRVRVATEKGTPFLEPAGRNETVVLKNPGSPVVSSNGAAGPVVWVLDMNGKRTDALVAAGGVAPPSPILYAFDGATLDLLWQSAPLPAGGKYNHVVVAHGFAIAGTDRLYGFGAQ